jgi:hypothetical protein
MGDAMVQIICPKAIVADRFPATYDGRAARPADRPRDRGMMFIGF